MLPHSSPGRTQLEPSCGMTSVGPRRVPSGAIATKLASPVPPTRQTILVDLPATFPSTAACASSNVPPSNNAHSPFEPRASPVIALAGEGGLQRAAPAARRRSRTVSFRGEVRRSTTGGTSFARTEIVATVPAGGTRGATAILGLPSPPPVASVAAERTRQAALRTASSAVAALELLAAAAPARVVAADLVSFCDHALRRR